ncbi:MAG: hypothetical protein FGM61_07275 [Sediminibacterium sp.]|nr:hypothetical protein [Sediminibacterium sp.]
MLVRIQFWAQAPFRLWREGVLVCKRGEYFRLSEQAKTHLHEDQNESGSGSESESGSGSGSGSESERVRLWRMVARV